MKYLLYLTLLFSSLVCSTAKAGTIAGTVINNNAILNFSQGASINVNIQSNNASFIVNELVDVQINWVDNTEVPVSSPDINKVLTYNIVNSGNGIQSFRLDPNYNIGGGVFNPLQPTQYLYVENNLQAGFQNSTIYSDTVYNVGDSILLNPGETKTIYLLANIPNNLNSLDKGFVDLRVYSTIPTLLTATKPGQSFPGLGKDGTDIVLGYSLGKGSKIGKYIVSEIIVSNIKSVVSVIDSNGGSLIAKDSIITYKILLNITGIGTVKNLRIGDILPNELKYKPNSLFLNGQAISDSTHVIGNDINITIGDVVSPNSFELLLSTIVN